MASMSPSGSNELGSGGSGGSAGENLCKQCSLRKSVIGLEHCEECTKKILLLHRKSNEKKKNPDKNSQLIDALDLAMKKALTDEETQFILDFIPEDVREDGKEVLEIIRGYKMSANLKNKSRKVDELRARLIQLYYGFKTPGILITESGWFAPKVLKKKMVNYAEDLESVHPNKVNYLSSSMGMLEKLIKGCGDVKRTEANLEAKICKKIDSQFLKIQRTKRREVIEEESGDDMDRSFEDNSTATNEAISLHLEASSATEIETSSDFLRRVYGDTVHAMPDGQNIAAPATAQQNGNPTTFVEARIEGYPDLGRGVATPSLSPTHSMVSTGFFKLTNRQGQDVVMLQPSPTSVPMPLPPASSADLGVLDGHLHPTHLGDEEAYAHKIPAGQSSLEHQKKVPARLSGYVLADKGKFSNKRKRSSADSSKIQAVNNNKPSMSMSKPLVPGTPPRSHPKSGKTSTPKSTEKDSPKRPGFSFVGDASREKQILNISQL